MPTPPIASTHPTSTTLHGVEVDDPYAWIADPEEPPVAAYLEAERAYYDARTAPLAGLRARLAAEMTGRLPAQESSAPWRQGGFVYRRETLPGTDAVVVDAHGVLHASSGLLHGRPQNPQ